MTSTYTVSARPVPTTVHDLVRGEAVPAVVGDHRDFLIVTGLGGPSRDVASINGDAENLFALGGAMGAASMTGLGLALAQPDRKVLVVTGDGELLMNVGCLATIAVVAPANLSILVVDNGRYGETGNQLAHTSRGVDLEAIARGCGFRSTFTAATTDDLPQAHDLLRAADGPVLVDLRVDSSEPPKCKRSMDGAANRVRFRQFLLGKGNA